MSSNLGSNIDCFPCFTIDYANGFLFCYTIGDDIGHDIRYIIDYDNAKAIEYAIDCAIGKVNGQ